MPPEPRWRSRLGKPEKVERFCASHMRLLVGGLLTFLAAGTGGPFWPPSCFVAPHKIRRVVVIG